MAENDPREGRKSLKTRSGDDAVQRPDPLFLQSGAEGGGTGQVWCGMVWSGVVSVVTGWALWLRTASASQQQRHSRWDPYSSRPLESQIPPIAQPLASTFVHSAMRLWPPPAEFLLGWTAECGVDCERNHGCGHPAQNTAVCARRHPGDVCCPGLLGSTDCTEPDNHDLYVKIAWESLASKHYQK